jgi:hypothetical protein
MKGFWVIGMFAASSVLAETVPVPVVIRDGQNYVNSKDLEQTAGIAIKSISSDKQIVACYGDRCALVNEFIREKEGVIVKVDLLEKALRVNASFDSSRTTVRFDSSATNDMLDDSLPQVGRLAPDFRLAKLDGTVMSLSDLRGKRVLINSWASW